MVRFDQNYPKTTQVRVGGHEFEIQPPGLRQRGRHALLGRRRNGWVRESRSRHRVLSDQLKDDAHRLLNQGRDVIPPVSGQGDRFSEQNIKTSKRRKGNRRIRSVGRECHGVVTPRLSRGGQSKDATR